MLGLYIDTVSPDNTIFLFRGEKMVAQKRWRAQHNEAEKILPAIATMFSRRKISWQNLKHIIVITGPGSFTSTRIGIMVANTLAVLLHIPVTGIDLFELMLRRIPHRDRKNYPLTIVLQSKQGDFFRAYYRSLYARSPITITGTVPASPSGKRIIIPFDSEVTTPWPLAPLREVVPNLVKIHRGKRTLAEPLYIRPPHITERKKR